MGWIFVDKDNEGSGMRSQMRRNMRGGYRYGGSPVMHGDTYEHGYRMGYKHGWEDKEKEWDDDDMDYRRGRDSRGRFI